MRGAVALSAALSALAVVVFSTSVMASEKPTAEFQGLMKSNGMAAGPTGLRGHVPAKDYDAIARDAETLESNLTRIEAFFTAKKWDDAVASSKAVRKGASDLAAAAKARDDGAIAAAMMAMNGSCGSCHMAHRQRMPDLSFEIKMTATQLIQIARRDPAQLRAALVTTLTADAIKNGTAVSGMGEDFIWAVDSATKPTLLLDDAPGPAMRKIAGASTWYAIGKYAVGTSHGFEYKIDGKAFGGSVNVPAYGPDSFPRPGVPAGTLSERFVHTSKIYDGLRSNYWLYVPAQYTPSTPVALMVFQDGQNYIQPDHERFRIIPVLDNLIAAHKIPVMIGVFVSPGDITQSPGSAFYKELEERFKALPPAEPGARARTLQSLVRGVQYDTVSDRYARFLRDELLTDIQAKYNIRKDAYSRAITGNSSGGIASFNVAWQQPDQFSRVLSWIGTFMAAQPVPDYGGQAFPAKVQREAKRNIRVWLQDGAMDQRTWPLQNLNMANSLKQAGYDFHFSYGIGTHHQAQGSAEFPASMIWLWRDYDPARTGQTYEMDAAERAKPDFRVRVYNRDHGPEY